VRERRSTAEARGDKRTTHLPASRGGVRIVEIAGDKLGTSHDIRDELILGRIPEIGVAIASPGISRRHAKLSRLESGTYVIEDLGSRNGTLVNGVPIDGKQPLEIGDRIQLGADVVFLFTRADPVDEHLSHLRRMEVVGRLTASVVHDFNNLLAVMLASLEHLEGLELDNVVPDDEAQASVEDALTAAKDAAALTRRLLTVARPAGTLKMRVSLSTVVDGVVRMCGRMFGEKVKISAVLPKNLWVLGDETELAQMLMNLCVNARDAMPEGGALKISGAPLDLTEHAPPIPLTSNYAVLAVEDEGVGMDAAVRERIFDPFFTTKGEGRGSGLGLATVYTSVRRMGGHVDVDSEPGRGTKFTLYLPLASQRPLAETAQVGRRVSIPGITSEARPLTVLIAADDPLARRAIRRLTRRAGHEACAFDQYEAREILATKVLTPDVIVVDPDGTEGSSLEGIDRILSGAGDAPVIVLAAYLPPETEAAIHESGAALILRKPAGAKDLQRALLAALVGGS